MSRSSKRTSDSSHPDLHPYRSGRRRREGLPKGPRRCRCMTSQVSGCRLSTLQSALARTNRCHCMRYTSCPFARCRSRQRDFRLKGLHLWRCRRGCRWRMPMSMCGFPAICCRPANRFHGRTRKYATCPFPQRCCSRCRRTPRWSRHLRLPMRNRRVWRRRSLLRSGML